jgi:ribonuclease HI
MGILCGLTILKNIEQYCNAKDLQMCKKITIESDSKSMIDKINKLSGRKLTQKSCNDKDMDIVIEILQLIKYLQGKKFMMSFKYVKGHQDTRTTGTLSTSATMNIRADKLATKGLSLRNIKNNINFPSNRATIYLNNKPITSN